MQGHTNAVYSVVFTSDGKQALSGSLDSTLKLWDLATGKEVRTLTGHTGRVNSVAVSRDGRFALSGSSDRSVRLWDLATGSELKSFKHGDDVGYVAFFPNGKTALAASRDEYIKQWDLASGSAISIRGHHLPVVLAPNALTALATLGHEISIWVLAKNSILRTFGPYRPTALAYSPSGVIAASAGDESNLTLWDLQTGKEIRTLKGHTDRVIAIAFSPDRRTLLSGSRDKTVKLWDIETGAVRRTFTGHERLVNAVAVSPDGHYGLSASGDGLSTTKDNSLRLWLLD